MHSPQCGLLHPIGKVYLQPEDIKPYGEDLNLQVEDVHLQLGDNPFQRVATDSSRRRDRPASRARVSDEGCARPGSDMPGLQPGRLTAFLPDS